jgi:polyhydroxybutyrate depolymerase
MDRSYFMAVPTNLSGRVPVVVLLHGRDMTPSGILRISGVAGGIGPAIVVVPEGWEELWNAGDCCGAAYLHHVDDVEFIAAVVHDVLAAAPAADPAQVYAIGFSNGGRLAYHLACRLPGTFHGVMAVEAVPVQPCPAMAPADVTIVAQQADRLLAVAAGQTPKKVGGFVEPTVAATVRDVRRLDGCTGAPTATVAGVAVERSWSCRAGTVVRYVWYPGGAHTWRPATATTPGVTGFARQLLGRSDASSGAAA